VEVQPLHARAEVVLVDARARAAYEAVHIPGAISLPEPPGEAEWAEFVARHARQEHIVVYCSSTSCSISYRLAHRLAREGGYTFVQYLTGGLQEWQREQARGAGPGKDPVAPVPAIGTPDGEAVGKVAETVMPRPLPPPATEPVTPEVAGGTPAVRLEHALPISWAQAQPMLATGQILLLDARTLEEFEAGHIPGAVSLPLASPPELIRSRLEGHPGSTRLVAYCGAMGCPEAFQLATRLLREFGVLNAQFLFEGYAEWQHHSRVAAESRP
jgi:rhodanese-related sulfurtransferase